jgi:hypothetical protein
MKKIVIWLLGVIVAVVLLAALAVHLFLDSAIKRGVESKGSTLTKVEVKLNSVHISLLSGSGKVKGLAVGNPEGFKTPSAISVGTASVSLQPRSIFSDPVMIHSIEVQAPEITFETDLHQNNLSKILANLKETTGSGGQQPTQPKEASAGKKLVIDDFRIIGGKIHVSVTMLGGRSATYPLDDIQLKDLGKDSGGITPADLSKKVLELILADAEKKAVAAIADIRSKGLTGAAGGLINSTNTNSSVEKVTKGLGDLLKKK